MRIGVDGFVAVDGGAISFRESGSRNEGIPSDLKGCCLSGVKLLPPDRSEVGHKSAVVTYLNIVSSVSLDLQAKS
jgi:hypothetical protein